ncbi:MAG: tetratricopeptide repeat protein [Actinomycetota bacterium]
MNAEYQDPLTFMLTDVEGSTRLWEREGDRMLSALERLERILGDVIAQNHGRWPKAQGEGDSSLSAFGSPRHALKAAIDLQSRLARDADMAAIPLKVRAGLHSGFAESRDGDYFGIDINKCARIRAMAHGGQTLISGSCVDLVGPELPEGALLTDLGTHRLKDIRQPERIFQLGHKDLVGSFPPIRSLGSVTDNLPSSLTRFLGRDSELASLTERISSHRLVNLVGPPGIGKTRLACEIASRLIERFTDGVWLIDVRDSDAATSIEDVVVDVLGLGVGSSSAGPTMLFEFLRGRRILLVLDGCDQRIAGCKAFAAKVLSGAPYLNILATCREPLGVAGEALFPVGPMHSGRDADGVQLFVDRARLSDPKFELDDASLEDVMSIIERVDGSPLAIEVAASNVQTLGTVLVAQRLQSDLSLLSLDSLLEINLERLRDEERDVLCRLAVFKGHFDLESAEAIVPQEAGSSDVAAIVAMLVSRSLIASQTHDVEPRFRLLEPIRDQALRSLRGSAEWETTNDLHFERFLALAEQARDALRTSDQRRWISRLERDQPNLQAAHSWALGNRSKAEALRLVTALSRFWYLRGRLSDGRRRLAEALDMQGSVDDLTLGRALGSAAALARAQGDFVSAAPAYQRSIECFRRIDDRLRIAWATRSLAAMEHEQGRYGSAKALYEEGLSLSASVEDQLGMVEALHGLGALLLRQGDLDGANQMRQKALGQARSLGDGWSIGVALNDLATLNLLIGDEAKAERLYSESFEQFHELDGTWGMAASELGLSQVRLTVGDREGALRLAISSIERSREIGDVRLLSHGMNALGHAKRMEGSDTEALDLFAESLRLAGPRGEVDVINEAVAGIALIASKNGLDDLSSNLFDDIQSGAAKGPSLMPPLIAEEIIKARSRQPIAMQTTPEPQREPISISQMIELSEEALYLLSGKLA